MADTGSIEIEQFTKWLKWQSTHRLSVTNDL